MNQQQDGREDKNKRQDQTSSILDDTTVDEDTSTKSSLDLDDEKNM